MENGYNDIATAPQATVGTRRRSIQRAKLILENYGDESGLTPVEPNLPEAIKDLITDLHHLADHTGLDFEDLLDGSAYHHRRESQFDLDDECEA